MSNFINSNCFCCFLVIVRPVLRGKVKTVKCLSLYSWPQLLDNANHWVEMYLEDNTMIIWFAGLEIKKILRLPFGDQLEKYSRQFVQCK